MSQNQEIIESKLCAYIDGELDAAGRTEIEKHLDANPQHRRLLESLKATRDLIKWLPREPAPPELAETLNGQLERSVLLDFDERSLNRNIWPRVLTAAAIILLTAGLGAAVYFTLPKGQQNATPYASRSNDSQSPMPDVNVPEPSVDATKPDDTLVASATMNKATSAPMLAKKDGDAAPNPELDRLADDVSQNQAAILAVANGAGPAQNNVRPISPNAIMMLVRTNSTEQATKDVTTYLESQKIQWKNAPQAGLDQNATQPAGFLAGGRGGMRSLQQQPVNRDFRERLSAAPTTMPEVAASPMTQSGFSQTSNLYVARMSRQQAVDLSNSVQLDRSQRAELKDLGAGSVPDSQNQALMASPTTLPGSPPAQTTLTGTVFGGAGGFGGGGGRGGGASAGAATTQSAALRGETAPATQSSDAPVDVVIVVQPDAIPPSTQAAQTEPATTQPASAPQPASQTQPAAN